MKVHTDCRHYRGEIPCSPHKDKGFHCLDCTEFDPIEERILIIKLGAIGDVIRTTPLLRKLKGIHPKAAFHWLTHTPEILPSCVDRAFRYDLASVEVIKATPYDWLFNLDKDREACALALAIHAAQKRGFILVDGHCAPLDPAAENKWLTGLFDDVSRKNLKSYPQEIFEICGFTYGGEEYLLDIPDDIEWDLAKDKKRIGLNTGCGTRWQTRLWPDAHWIELARWLKKEGYDVLFLGGEQEHQKNRRLARSADVRYLGHFPLQEFISLLNQCDLVVTAVTMALHIAIGLKKKVVLFNNIFNPHEFELFNRGLIVEPPKSCKGCYMSACSEPCMELIRPEQVLQHIRQMMR